jgi:hypothetical protein
MIWEILNYFVLGLVLLIGIVGIVAHVSVMMSYLIARYGGVNN